MKKKLLHYFLVSVLLLTNVTLFAQTPETYTSADIYQQLKKLKVLGSVLYIAAHPDDENNTLLPFLAKEKLYRTGYMSLTRGDGGQNLIGDEQGLELGLIRTQELLAARRMDGAEQYFSRAFDFGFSKNADEALAIWGHDKILSDVVWVIRKFQPDVIITRFPRDARAGHGQHWASAILANEAFKAAADTTMFPEQFKYGVTPWQAKRILWNSYNFNGPPDNNNTLFKFDAGGYNVSLGKSYGEIGAEARTMHKSQGEGRPRRRGESFEYFETTGGDMPQQSLMDGIDISWNRLNTIDTSAASLDRMYKDLKKLNNDITKQQMKVSYASTYAQQETSIEKIEKQIDRIIAQYNFEHPENSVDSLLELYKSVTILYSHETWWQKKMREIENIILACGGVFVEATTNTEYAVPGDSLSVQFYVNKRNSANINLESIRLNAFDTTVNWALPVNQNAAFTKRLQVALSKELSQPYWLEKPMTQGSFQVDDQLMIGEAESWPAYTARFIFNINGTKLFINRPVKYKFTDPAKGELYEPVQVITPVTVSLSPNILLTNVNPGNEVTQNPSVKLEYKSNINAKNVPVTLTLKQPGYVIKATASKETGADSNDSAVNSVPEKIIYVKDTTIDFETGKTFSTSIPLKGIIDNKHGGKENRISASITTNINGKKLSYSHYLRPIEYDHIPHIHYFYKDNVTVITDEIKTSGKKIGYIVGAGDKLPQLLVQMGYEVKLLNDIDITDANLKQFDAIITGVRAYDINSFLTSKYDILMRYVYNGGNIIAQYNRSPLIASGVIKPGPYPFAISGTRVTNETAEVKFLLPNHPVLNYPNKITSDDFNNWVQERSIYQADHLDSHYETPFAMHDPNEQESNGSLIIAPYGKGNFAYTGLVFFREMPAGISGAYKLMANLVALPQHKTN